MKLAGLILLLALPEASQASESCPWLNAATASGVLGAPATLSHHEEGLCTFESPAGSLRIAVQTSETPRTEFSARAKECGTDAALLKAIGNEAVVCNRHQSAQVIGHVRNSIFTILISTAHSQLALREKARQIAEQVAGNLF